MNNFKSCRRIAIYKPFGIGDSLFALVISSVIKLAHPHSYVTFIGTSYSKDLLIQHQSIDDFINLDKISLTTETLKSFNLDMIIFAFSNRHVMKLAKKVKIPNRIGFGDKIYTFLYCNYFSGFFKTKHIRHNSHRLMYGYLLYQVIDPASQSTPKEIVNAISYQTYPEEYRQITLHPHKFKLIIHPGAQSAQFRNWPPK